MPRKVFTAGEVLAAADVNSFLMDQTIMTFAGTAARGSAIGTATEGMYAHLNDTDTLTYYNGSAWVNRIPTSAILQVQSATFTGVFTNTTTTFQDTGISVSITPSSTASKILVTGSVNTGSVGFASNAGFIRLLRNSTDIALGDTAGSRIRTYTGSGFDSALMVSSSINFLDSPSSTSSTTYKIQLASNSAGFLASINRHGGDADNVFVPRGVSTITVMEVAG